MNITNLMRWPWTRWQDICVFGYGGYAHLLQGRRNIITGRSQFAVRKFKQWYRVCEPSTVTVSDLERAGLWTPEQPKP